MTAKKQGMRSSVRFRVTSTRPHTGMAGPIGVPMLGFKNNRHLSGLDGLSQVILADFLYCIYSIDTVW